MLALVGCDGGGPPLPPGLAECPPAAIPEVAGTVTVDGLTEASGLVAGESAAWWTHNDSGDVPRVFALGADGRALGNAVLRFAQPVDMEDLARVETDDGVDLVLGDIGDNALRRDDVVFYRFAEPDPSGGEVEVTPTALVATYEDEEPRDAEAFLVDPVEGRLFLFTKVNTGVVEVFAAPADARNSTVLEAVGQLDVTELPEGDTNRFLTGATVSPAGDWVALRSYRMAWIWPRLAGEPLLDALARPPCEAPLANEPQGEAIGWGGVGFATLSEGEDQPLYVYPWE